MFSLGGGATALLLVVAAAPASELHSAMGQSEVLWQAGRLQTQVHVATPVSAVTSPFGLLYQHQQVARPRLEAALWHLLRALPLSSSLLLGEHLATDSQGSQILMQRMKAQLQLQFPRIFSDGGILVKGSLSWEQGVFAAITDGLRRSQVGVSQTDLDISATLAPPTSPQRQRPCRAVVIDARHLAIKPCLFPAIHSTGGATLASVEKLPTGCSKPYVRYISDLTTVPFDLSDMCIIRAHVPPPQLSQTVLLCSSIWVAEEDFGLPAAAFTDPHMGHVWLLVDGKRFGS